MSQFLLPCSCGANVPVSRSQAGMTLPCPECGKVVDVPTIRVMNTLQVATQTAIPVAGKSQSTWLRIFAVICFIVTLVTGYFGGELFLLRRNIENSMASRDIPLNMTEQDFLDDMKQAALKRPPADTWDYWNELINDGLLPPNPPDYFKVKRHYEAQYRPMVNWLTACGVSLGLFLISFMLMLFKKA